MLSRDVSSDQNVIITQTFLTITLLSFYDGTFTNRKKLRNNMTKRLNRVATFENAIKITTDSLNI